MHVNYHFFKHLVPAIEKKIIDTQLKDCFTQNKDELILVFQHSNNQLFFIKSLCSTSFAGFDFPNVLHKAKKNSVRLFEYLLNMEVTKVRLIQNDRSFIIELSSKYKLIFKMHGGHANILVCQEDKVIDLFHKDRTYDWSITPNKLSKELNQTFKEYLEQDEQLKLIFPTFGPILNSYVQQQLTTGDTSEKRWQLLQSILFSIENSRFYLCELGEKLHLTLIKIGEVRSTYTDPLQASHEFYVQYHNNKRYTDLAKKLKQNLVKRQKATLQYITKLKNRLTDLKTSNYRELADVIMGNLHQIKAGENGVTLFNFYDNQMVTIKLNAQLSPQKNAERFYQKAKHQAKELEVIQKNLQEKEGLLTTTNQQINDIKKANSWQELLELDIEVPHQGQIQPKDSINFKSTQINQYTIYIGKNAKNNDQLLRMGHKNDIWLHAKGFAGSHVLIKHKNNEVPQGIIEKAAQLAAWYSKGKGQGLCPVIFTPLKYVRKPKGAAPGAVKVMIEKTLLVKPSALSNMDH